MEFTEEDFDEIEYKLSNCIRITLEIEHFKTEVNTRLNQEHWVPVVDYVKAYTEWLATPVNKE